MAKSFSVPRGTADILPSEIASWHFLENKARTLFSSYGYKEIRTPMFEERDLFVRSMGQTSEVVNKQLLELAGDKKETFALRPEGTASIVRSYVENGVSKKESLTKLFYIGAMFRGERPQKGRLRQFHQIGIEVLGPQTANPYLDAEVLAVSVNFLKSLGWEKPNLLINSLGTQADKENFANWLRKELKPNVAKLGAEDQGRLERNVFRVLDSKDPQTQAVIAKLKISHDHLSKESLEYYSKVKAALDSLGVSYEERPTLVRGLDYYTHTVFEITDSSLGSQDALGAGGRYNSLVSELGGDAVDAIGFALGMERILLALPQGLDVKSDFLDAYIIALDEASFQKSFVLLNQLRQEEVRCDICYQLGSMKSMMRSADKSGARFVLIIGEEEVRRKFVTLKLMETGSQQTISIEDIHQLANIIKKERK